jgi:hypothetical protein
LATVVAATAAAAVASLVGFVSPSRADNQCPRIVAEARFTSFTFTSATTAVGEAVVTGDVVGTVHADYWDIHQHGNGVITTQASHVFTTADGSFVTSDDIRLLPDTEPGFVRPHSRLRVVEGSGAYEGVTGVLQSSGRVNLTTLAGSIVLEGTICRDERGSDDAAATG